MKSLAVTFSLLALLVLSPNALAQGSASGDTYKDPFSNNSSQAPGKTAPASKANKSTPKHESSGSGLALVLVLVGLVLLTAAALTIRQRRRSRDGPNG